MKNDIDMLHYVRIICKNTANISYMQILTHKMSHNTLRLSQCKAKENDTPLNNDDDNVNDDDNIKL